MLLSPDLDPRRLKRYVAELTENKIPFVCLGPTSSQNSSREKFTITLIEIMALKIHLTHYPSTPYHKVEINRHFALRAHLGSPPLFLSHNFRSVSICSIERSV